MGYLRKTSKEHAHIKTKQTRDEHPTSIKHTRLVVRTPSTPPTPLCYVASSASILTKRGAGNSVFSRDPRLAEGPSQGCLAVEQLWVPVDGGSLREE